MAPFNNNDDHRWQQYDSPVTWGDYPIGKYITYKCANCDLFLRCHHDKNHRYYAKLSLGYPIPANYKKCIIT